MTEPTQAQIDAAQSDLFKRYGIAIDTEELRTALTAASEVGDAYDALRDALQLFIQTVNPPYPQSMALWQEHLKAATAKAKAALTAAAEVEKNKADWKVCERCNCWVKRPLEWEPECSEVPDAMTKDFFGTAAAQVGEPMRNEAGKHGNICAESVPTDPNKFKSWADRECGKWPSKLQVMAHDAWCDWDTPETVREFVLAYAEWSNR